MKILLASSEMVPFAKSGGLGDVLGALPKALTKLGHDLKIFLPNYSTIDKSGLKIQKIVGNIHVPVGNVNEILYLEKAKIPKIGEIYFIGNDKFFDRPSLYLDPETGEDYEDNDQRFIFFSRAILESLKVIEWQPDIINAHDWQSGLLPVYLKTLYKDDEFFNKTKSVLTIHNLAYQGTFEAEKFENLALPKNLFYSTSPLEFYGKVNFLKGAIEYSDKITTVSKTYAEEIQTTSELGCGLEGVLSQRKDDLLGILNGVDYHVWSPSRDKKIPFNYYRANLTGKRENKVELLNQSNLPVRDNAPLIGIISRLVDQKGFDLIAEVTDKIFSLDIQMIVLGTGEEKYHKLFKELEGKYPDKIKVYLEFNDQMAHLIEAGSDIFLMPSKFEPCGLNQMFSLKYGTIPIIRKVGGLADTVKDFDEIKYKGTGFVFENYDSEELLDTIKRAVKIYKKKRVWVKIVKEAMLEDYSWDKSAKHYVQLFSSLINN